ncbi:MAG: histone deacetylase [Deltaproteobacteria bacterium]|nr:histone deacetylase [Deltaproteobacteria bacterium]
MRLVYTENMHALMLPRGHKFPLGKYDMIHTALAREHGDKLMLGAMASFDDILLVHDRDYAVAVRDGTLAPSAVRRLGFPWSESLVTRAMRSVGGTLAALSWAAAHGAAGHIAGGTHHAFRDRGEGFCVFNDIAVAVAVGRRDHGLARAAVVDLDVHQGNGTAAIFAGDPSVFTVSLHGEKNYPFKKEASSLDVALPDGCDDNTYLAALAPALEQVEGHRPDVVFYQSGVDCLRGDRLGRMALSHEGLARRDAMVFALAKRLGVPLVATLGGGYGRDIQTSVRGHVGVFMGLCAAYAG